MSLTSLRSNTNDLRQSLERGEVVELTFHGKVIGLANPTKTQHADYDETIINAYFNKRRGDDPYAAVEQVKQARQGRTFT